MEPHARELLVVGGLGLSNLVLVMRKHQVDPARMDVDRLAKVALAHRRALDVPAGPALAERRIPRGSKLLVLWLRLLPEREVAHRLLVVFVGRHSGAGLETAAVEMGQRAI